MSLPRLWSAALVLCAVLAAPAAANAATRYAAPSGSGTACTQASPCDLVTAVNSAQSGDTVIVGAGTYGSAGSPLTTQLNDNGETIEGAVTGPARPVIYESGDAGIHLAGNGSSVTDLDIEFSGNDGIYLTGTNESATRVVVRSTVNTADDACELYGPGSESLIDSLCVSTNPASNSGAGIQSGATATLRNDTLVGAYGLYTDGTADVVNSIIHGSIDDLYSNLAPAFTNVEFSTVRNNANPPSPNDNPVSAAPVFVDAAAGDYHEAPASPSVAAGAVDPANGTIDLDGILRTIDGETDIGAYELLGAATATTGTPGAVSDAGATLTGTLNSAGGQASYYFEYGTGTGYGSVTPTVTLPAATGSQSVSAQLTGLAPNTTYHYQLVVSTAASTNVGGGDATLTTSPIPPTCAPVSTTTAYGSAVNVTFSCAGTALTYRVSAAPAHGTLGAISGNTVTYVPGSGFSGSDGFAVQATDSAGQTATEAVSVGVGPPGNVLPQPGHRTIVATLDNQQISLTTESPVGCTGGADTLDESLKSRTIPKSKAPKLKFSSAAFFIDKGVKHTRRKHKKLITTYTANATEHHLPITAHLSLRGLKLGTHTLKVVVSYKNKHGHTVTKTLRARFVVC
jgi:Bacterial Ig domain